MSVDELQHALDELRTARTQVDGEADDRVSQIADRIANHLEDGRTVDHGTLARMDRTLADIQTDESGDTAAAVSDARDALRTYREGVPGA